MLWENEFNEIMQELSKYEVTISKQLKSAHMTRKEALEGAKEWRKQFWECAGKYHLSMEDKVKFCGEFLKLVQSRKELAETLEIEDEQVVWEELVLVYTGVIGDRGYLFHNETERIDEELIITCYLEFREEFKKNKEDLRLRRLYGEEFRKIKADVRQFYQSPVTSVYHAEKSRIRQLTKIFIDNFDVHNELDKERLQFNLGKLEQYALGQQELQKILPFFFYQIFIKHKSRLIKQDDIRISMEKLWEYREYKIDENNGRNFHSLEKSIELFEDLMALYTEVEEVDKPLSAYAFYLSTNINEWFYQNYNVTEEEEKNFVRPLKTIVLHSPFRCFENGAEEAPLYMMFCKKYQSDKQMLETLEEAERGNTGEEIEKSLREDISWYEKYSLLRQKENTRELAEFVEVTMKEQYRNWKRIHPGVALALTDSIMLRLTENLAGEKMALAGEWLAGTKNV